MSNHPGGWVKNFNKKETHLLLIVAFTEAINNSGGVNGIQ